MFCNFILARSRCYFAEIMIVANYAHDPAVFTNTPAQVESLLSNLEQAAGGNGLDVNTNKTEYTCVLTRRSYLHFKWL